MIEYSDLLRIASGLAAGDIGGSYLGRPRETDLRRAVSATYYAMFHALARTCADMLVGLSRANQSRRAWVQAYRAPDHGPVRSRCNRTDDMNEFPSVIQDFGKMLVEMQAMRHRADYAPFGAQFKRESVMNLIQEAEDAIDLFLQTDASERRAFAIYLLLPIRNE